MSRTFWDAQALAALVAGDEAAGYELEGATAIVALATCKVDTPAIVRRTALSEFSADRAAAWAELMAAIAFVPIDDDLIEEAFQLAEEFFLPSDHAWPLAAAIRTRCERVVSASEELLVTAQMLGLRVALVGGD